MEQMKALASSTLDLFWYDVDIREERLREIVRDRLAEKPPPVLDDQVVATYFFAFRTQTLVEAASCERNQLPRHERNAPSAGGVAY